MKNEYPEISRILALAFCIVEMREYYMKKYRTAVITGILPEVKPRTMQFKELEKHLKSMRNQTTMYSLEIGDQTFILKKNDVYKLL